MNSMSFVVIDVETTGLTPSQNEIIEIGMIKINNGLLNETYESFIKPKVKIPHIITRLTGIKDRDVADAPKFIDIVNIIKDFIGDSILIGHNIGFDFAMLNSALIRENLPLLTNQTIDTLDVFSIIKPIYPSYKLEYIANNYLNKTDNFHRALNDAKITGELFLNSLNDIKENKELLNIICYIFKESNSVLGKIFHTFQGETSSEKYKLNDIIKKSDHKSVPDTSHVEVNRKDLYSRNNIIQNKRINKKINSFLDKDKGVVINTQNGEDNYLSCVIESAVWAKKNNQPVIISFDEHNQKTPAQIRTITRNAFKVSIIEKSNNYACLNKINILLKNISKNKNTSKLPDFAALLHWLQITDEGKIDELHKRISAIFEKSISSDSIYCKNKNCRFAENCFISRSKQVAKDSQLVFINHKSLLPILADKNKINMHKTIIFDAHKLINFDRSSHVESISTKTIYNISNKLINRKINIYNELSLKMDSSTITQLCEFVTKSIEKYNSANEHLLSAFEQAIKNNQKTSRKNNISNVNIVDIINSSNIEEIKEAINTLSECKSEIQVTNNQIIVELKKSDKYNKKTLQKILHHNDSLNHIANYLNSFFLQSKNEIKWCEFHHNVRRNTLSFYKSNIDSNLNIRPILENENTAYLSPIINFGNKLDYFTSKLSLKKHTQLNIKSDFKSRIKYCKLKELKGNSRGIDKSELLNELLIKSKSRLLIISRKKSKIYSIYKGLTHKTNKSIIHSHHQFISKKDINSFNANSKAILMSTYDQLQSIKYKIDAKCIIILDLPFMDISSPYNYYRISQIRKKQKHWFNSYVLPEAVLKYKSTIYNIICNRKGLTSVVDISPRLKKKYGTFFTKWMPKPLTLNIEKCIQIIDEK